MTKEIKEAMFAAAVSTGFSVWTFIIQLTNLRGGWRDVIPFSIGVVMLGIGIYQALKAITLAITGAEETFKMFGKPARGESHYSGPERTFEMAGEPTVLPEDRGGGRTET